MDAVERLTEVKEEKETKETVHSAASSTSPGRNLLVCAHFLAIQAPL